MHADFLIHITTYGYNQNSYVHNKKRTHCICIRGWLTPKPEQSWYQVLCRIIYPSTRVIIWFVRIAVCTRPRLDPRTRSARAFQTAVIDFASLRAKLHYSAIHDSSIYNRGLDIEYIYLQSAQRPASRWWHHHKYYSNLACLRVDAITSLRIYRTNRTLQASWHSCFTFVTLGCVYRKCPDASSRLLQKCGKARYACMYTCMLTRSRANTRSLNFANIRCIRFVRNGSAIWFLLLFVRRHPQDTSHWWPTYIRTYI